ncbi:S8 family serine peptidase, partial [Flavobacteriaceae bacterium]|nr:S8 family serine peptidase [Flavobacteriaceae bacterium]
MKKLLILIVLVSQVTWGQMPPAVQQDLMNFEPGELIVKLKDNVDANVTYAENGKAMSSFNIGELLGIEDKIESSSVMFHQKAIEASVLNSQKMKAVYLSKGMTNPKDPLTMKNIFVLKTNNVQENILMLIEEIKNNPNVEYAEPNYIYSIDDFEVGEIIYDETTDSDNEQESSETSDATIDVDDPLYSSQTNITSTNIDDVWDQYTTGDGSQVIAILDTGVDYTHPDLEANTWINTEELNGVEGYDDDGNGYIDDIRGWDFINIDNAPLDDNMHGTHVAGIAGAVGNNGIGIAGAAWNVKLMPIKVFQSTGQGNATTIADGVEYASSNGATIINMSFGSYAESSTLRLVLENAYVTSILVAAAGNDRSTIVPFPFYPAAYNYVLGVEDAAGYSNFDQDGPVYSSYLTLLNYELIAPGTAIMSTIPGGGYNTLTGTSMSAPLVSGAMALYNQQKPEDSKELMFGNLVNTSGSTYVDFLAAIEVEPVPKLAVLNHILRDTINSQNGNGFWQPGETIEILPLVKNYWGPTDDVRVGIAFAEFEDQSKATIIQNEAQIGSISAYATLQDLFQTLKITLADNIANNVDIKFVLTTWSGPDQEYMSDPVEIVINVKNSILLYGVKSDQVVLTADKEYLVSANLALVNDADYTIMPGTIIKISDGVKILIKDNAKLTANGNNDSRIIFQAENNNWSGIKSTSDNSVTFDYTEFRNVVQYQVQLFQGNNSSTISNSLFIDCFSYDGLSTGFNISDSNIIENDFANHIIELFNNEVTNTIIANNGTSGNYGGVSVGAYNSLDFIDSNNLNIFNNEFNMNATSGAYTIDIPSNIYLGSFIEEIIRIKLIDFLVNINSQGILNTDNVSESAIPSTKGIVWKVEVNGFDAQDEYALLDPLGVGSHEFKVYFNRAMDTTIDPRVSYGVTIPYNQKIISETGTWSEDGKIYTVTHDINIGAADGINRIRVQDAQDLDYFKIPVEDTRFNFLLQSAGSASAGWYATPGLGKIALTWEAPLAEDIDDALGY